jgi:catecholate siderophore receptor
MMVYLGPSVLDGTPLTLNPIQLPRLRDGFTAQTLFPSAPAGSTAQATFTTVPNVFRQIHNGTTGSREVIKSRAAVLHSYWLDNLLVTTLGWRRDEGYLSRLNLPSNVNNKLAWGRNDFAFADTPPPNAAKEVKTVSAVLRWPHRFVRLPRGMNASVFTNVSENFTPAGTRVDFNNESLPSPAGKTREIGFNLTFFDNKLSLRYNKFETSTRGATLSGGPLGNMFNNSILQIISLLVADQNNVNNLGTTDRRPAINALLAPLPRYREAVNFQMSGTGALDDPLTASWTPLGVSDTTDIVSKGHELEIIYNPTRQLRLLANVANQEAVQSNIAPVTRELVKLMLPVWTGDLVGNSPRGGFPNVRAYVTETSLTPYYSLIETEGISTAEVRKWRANFVANYTFARASRLRGWGVGTGIRWQDKVAIGYPTSRRPDNTVALDRANPYYGPQEINVDGWVSYGRRIWKDRLDWKIQLNVRNLIGDDKLIPINAQPDGSVASYRLPPERRWYITNTFTF